MLAPAIPQDIQGWTAAKQLVRAGTSIGANVEEAEAAYSRDDFICRMTIALREARETRYWLRLIKTTSLLEGTDLDAALQEAEELKRILGAIVSTAPGKRKPSVKDI